MSDMTLSSAPSNHQKALTNFSIKSIIGEFSLGDATEQAKAPRASQSSRGHISVQIKKGDKSKRTSLSKTSDSPKAKEIVNSEEATYQQQQQRQRKYRPKNFHCLSCKMAFSNNGQLKNHVRIHTGERPFRCNQIDCNKTFTRNEELTRHKLIHTGLRPHSCTVCGKRFGRKDHLKKHIRTHERKKLRKKIYPSLQYNSAHQHPHLLTLKDVFVPSTTTTTSDVSVSIGKQLYSSERKLNQSATTTTTTTTMQLRASQRDQLKLSEQSAQRLPTLPSAISLAGGALNSHPQNAHFSMMQQAQGLFVSSSPAIANQAIQQLASDYWYNLVGFYQQQTTQLFPPST